MPQNRNSHTRLERVGELVSRFGSLQPSDPNLRRGLHSSIAALIAFSVVLAGVAAFNDLPDLSLQFRPGWIALGTLGFAVLLLFNAWVWRSLLETLGPRLLPLRATAIWCASALGRYVPTGVVLPVMRVALSEREGVPKRICLASVVYEGALSLTAALVIGAYFVVDLPELQGHAVRFVAPALPVIAIILLQPRIFHRLANWALSRLGRAPLPLALAGSGVLRFIGLYAISFAIGGLSVYALAAGVYPVAGGDLAVVTGAFAEATALSAIAFILPGGLVAREAGLAVALSPVMPTSVGLAVAVIVRIVQLGLEVLLALLTPLLARSRDGRRRGGDGRQIRGGDGPTQVASSSAGPRRAR